jgi:hypothetical protein
MNAPETPHAELATLRERLVDCEQRLAALPRYEEEARLAVADREELDRLRDRVEALERELAEAQELRDRAERVADEMKASLSWRLTAPLRRLKRSSPSP